MFIQTKKMYIKYIVKLVFNSLVATRTITLFCIDTALIQVNIIILIIIAFFIITIAFINFAAIVVCTADTGVSNLWAVMISLPTLATGTTYADKCTPKPKDAQQRHKYWRVPNPEATV